MATAPDRVKTGFEGASPILSVRNMAVSVRYYMGSEPRADMPFADRFKD